MQEKMFMIHEEKAFIVANGTGTGVGTAGGSVPADQNVGQGIVTEPAVAQTNSETKQLDPIGGVIALVLLVLLIFYAFKAANV